MSIQPPKNSYSNPAFCQQSEYYSSPPRCPKSPSRSVRQSPVGAQTPMHLLDTSIHELPPPKPGPKPPTSKYVHEKYEEEQEFYEEMIVDDKGAVRDKKFVVVHNDSRRGCGRYGSVPPPHGDDSGRYEQKRAIMKNRYEYIPMQEHDLPPPPRVTSPPRIQYHEEVEASTGVIHRYAVITPEDDEVEEEEQLPQSSGRYALVPVEEIQHKNRYAVITQEANRYEYITPTKIVSPQPPRRGNPVATQKLHELLTTPKKNPTPKLQRPQIVHQTPKQQPIAPIVRTPKHTPSKAQQKLNYTLGTRQMAQDKRHTAIVAPICSSPVQSVYSETTFSNKTESWMNISISKPPVQMALTISTIMMTLCGGVTSTLCFYMISFMGRLYFLDFGILAGFTCLLLGLMGFRSRNVYWLPNRNYISGYFILSIFSLLTCAGLLVLLFLQPKPGTPLADMTSGAVCGLSGLSLLIASTGVLASYCCKVPPPDNRVQHCAQGFTV